MPATLTQFKAPTKKPHRRPRFEEIAPHKAGMALANYAQTGNAVSAAELGGCSKSTVERMLQRNPEDFRAIQKVIAGKALTNSALMSAAVTPAKANKLNALQLVIGAKVAGQHALEMLEKNAPSVMIQVGQVASLSTQLDQLRQALQVSEQPLVSDSTAEVSTSAPPATLGH